MKYDNKSIEVLKSILTFNNFTLVWKKKNHLELIINLHHVITWGIFFGPC